MTQGLTIKSVSARPAMVPLSRPITTAKVAIDKAPLVLIDVNAKEGVIGRSYIFGYTPLSLRPLTAMVENIADTLIGKTIDPATRFAEMEAMFRLLGRQGVVGMAMAGLDVAFWDARAKAQDMSVAVLLGAEQRPIKCYDSHGFFDPKRDAKDLELSLTQGFDALKFKLGAETVEEDLARLRAGQDIVGSDKALMLDYNQAFSSAEAIRRMRRIEEEFDLDWIEEPVLAEDYAGHRAVRAAIRTPVQTGENWWLPDDAARAVQAEICDHAMLDLIKIGGVTGWMRAAAIAQGASLPVSSHLFPEASAHVLAATPNCHLLEWMDVTSAIAVEPYEIENGHLAPKGPGFGLEWDEKALAKYLL